MCDKCDGKVKHWVHISDGWTEEEKLELMRYLFKENLTNIHTELRKLNGGDSLKENIYLKVIE